jgi:hypothetical protein
MFQEQLPIQLMLQIQLYWFVNSENKFLINTDMKQPEVFPVPFCPGILNTTQIGLL